ncbi:phosphatase PAP2 family protein [Glaesserella sp.]|uniref:phosphatase PAP2 family protein n=1 Tax=Glaesserella sp. TaxID=2094731 RepID=UPI0035A098BB
MVKKLFLFMLLLLSIPIITWLIGYQWAGEQIPIIDTPLLFISDIIGIPNTFYICVIFMLWIMWLARKKYSWLLIGGICAFSVISVHYLKETTKNIFMEPRPYITYLLQEDAETFYQIADEEERQQIINSFIREGEYKPFDEHRARNLGFSFPSGHTIFIDSWIFIFIGFLYGKQHGHPRRSSIIFALSFLYISAILMSISRIRLGMHYPIDVAASTLISYLFHLIIFVAIVPFLSKLKIFQYKWFNIA